MRRIFVGATMIATVATLGACTGNTVTNPQEIVFPDTAVSYRNHVDPFLTLQCGNCHGSLNPAGGINLTEYTNLFKDRPNLVVPTKPDESLLNQVLELRIAHPVGNINLLPSNHVTGMRTWVSEGAYNN